MAMPLLEFYTAFAIATKMPVLVLIFKDGLAVPANFTQYKIAQQVQGMENHIQLSLNDILQGFFPDVDLKAKYKNELPMSVNEMELLAYLRIANFERITVKFNNCLLYTSDAADERSSVDLGGRRIIKKKKKTRDE